MTLREISLKLDNCMTRQDFGLSQDMPLPLPILPCCGHRQCLGRLRSQSAIDLIIRLLALQVIRVDSSLDSTPSYTLDCPRRQPSPSYLSPFPLTVAGILITLKMRIILVQLKVKKWKTINY